LGDPVQKAVIIDVPDSESTRQPGPGPYIPERVR